MKQHIYRLGGHRHVPNKGKTVAISPLVGGENGICLCEASKVERRAEVRGVGYGVTLERS